MVGILKRIYHFSEKQKKNVFFSIVFGTLQSIFEVLQLAAVCMLFRLMTGSTTSHPILKLAVIMAVSIIGIVVMNSISHLLQCKAGLYMAADRRMTIGERMKRMPMGYFNSTSLGTITSVISSQLYNIENTAAKVLSNVLQGLIYTFVVTAAVMVFEWRIGLLILLGIIMFLAVVSLMFKSSGRTAPRKAEADRRLTEDVLEFINGNIIFRTFRTTKYDKNAIYHSLQESQEAETDFERKTLPFTTAAQLVLRLASGLILLVSVLLYFDGQMRLADALLMLLVSSVVFKQIEIAGSMITILRNIDISINAANDMDKIKLMDEKGSDLKPENYDIEVCNVDFSYENRRVLSDVSVRIPTKSSFAIVGYSGSGKTTLCNLITRFWDPDSGKILLGGRDLRDYTIESLMQNFSIVFQHTYLFQDTIMNNIRFGKPDATDEEVYEAAKKAQCHDFITALKDGYQTVIGEGGATVSGGERQRIAIARAIIKDSPIIVLDEATASVDPENAMLLQAALNALTENKTLIMIAHQLKTVENADQIIVMKEGRIVQRGNHASLSQTDGIYRNFIAEREKAGDWKL